jgi:hypothetical protein
MGSTRPSHHVKGQENNKGEGSEADEDTEGLKERKKKRFSIIFDTSSTSVFNT